MSTRWICWAGAVMALVSGAVAQQVDRNKKVLDDRDRIEASGFWIYNSLERGVAEAKNQKKPLLVVFRCVPCEHCAQLDESLVSRDPSVQKLLEQFVCVRIVKANGMDLSLFQFDYDQSWTAFMMNPDLTIYGRYGTRSHRTESANDMSLVGFGKALEGALALHRGYPANRALFAAKRGSEPKFKSPEEFPWLKGRYTQNLDFGPKVAQSCIHCHQVGEGMRTQYRSAGLPIPEEVLFPYPNPRVVGLVMDPQSRATVKEVRPNTPAAAAGFQPGDEIDTVSAQPMLSTADIQWTLQHAGPTATLRCEARRAGKKLPLTLNLTSGWRRNDDISWRATSWDLRRMTTGGMVLEDASPEQRKQAGLAENTLALNVKSVGQYGAHAAAKNAGFRPADLIVGVDGHTEAMTESGWMAFLVNAHRPGEEVTVRLLRNGEKLQLRLPMQ